MKYIPVSGEPFFRWEGETLVINILGQPSAGVDAIGQPNGSQLNVSVTAVPRFGRATDHMVVFLAQEFGVDTSAIKVIHGRMNVNKLLRIHAPQKIPKVLRSLLKKH